MDMAEDSVPDMFAFGDVLGQLGSGGDNFFHLLDFATAPDFRVNPWPS